MVDKQIMTYCSQGKGHRCIIETKKESSVFMFKSEAECDLLKVNQYLKMREIWKLPSADKKRKWTNKDWSNFKSVDWIAFTPQKSHNSFKSEGFHAPEVLCDAMWSWGFELLSISELKRVINKESTNRRINKLCKDNSYISSEKAKRIVRKQINLSTVQIKAERDLNLLTDASKSKRNEWQQKKHQKQASESSLKAMLG